MTEPTKLTIVFLIVMSIGLIALAIEWLRMKVNGWMILIIVSLMLLALALSIHPARSHDHQRADLNKWFDNLKSNAGALCCTNNDGTVLEDADWESNKGGYRVRLFGEWYDVPEGAVVTAPNLSGRTMVWPRRSFMGALRIVCFMPGPMS